MRRAHLRSVAPVIAAASMLAFSPSAALAGETAYLTTQGGPIVDWSPGHITAGITVEFLSKKAYDLNGWVEDVCPNWRL